MRTIYIIFSVQWLAIWYLLYKDWVNGKEIERLFHISKLGNNVNDLLHQRVKDLEDIVIRIREFILELRKSKSK